MKKQILFLAMFLVAMIFAGTSMSYGQCVAGRLSPAPGVEYDYVATLAGATANPTYLWYATEDVNLTTGTHIAIGTYFNLGPTAGSTYDVVAGGTGTINLVWLPSVIGKTIYLVIKTTAEGTANGETCIVENTKVYEIKPVNTFLLAAAGSDLSGDIAKSEVCVAPIESAIVTPGGPSVTYLYGTNSLYYKITASGILGNWRPSIQLPALTAAQIAAGQTYVSADWTPDGGTTWNTLNLASGNTVGGDLVSTVDANVTDVAGTSIVVRIVVDNERFETLADQVITIGVDGYLPTAYSISDIVGGTGTDACDQLGAFLRTATSTIKLRPTVTPGTSPFITETH